MASFLAYASEKRINKRSRYFGNGEYAGVAAPETANNAAAMSSFIPLLALGIPGGAVAAVMYAVLAIHGLQPGPLLAVQNPGVLQTIYVAALAANVLILLVGLVEAHHTVHLLKVPEHVLLPAVIVFAAIGAYSLNNDLFDVWVALVFGVIRMWMRLRHFSLLP